MHGLPRADALGDGVPAAFGAAAAALGALLAAASQTGPRLCPAPPAVMAAAPGPHPADPAAAVTSPRQVYMQRLLRAQHERERLHAAATALQRDRVAAELAYRRQVAAYQTLCAAVPAVDGSRGGIAVPGRRAAPAAPVFGEPAAKDTPATPTAPRTPVFLSPSVHALGVRRAPAAAGGGILVSPSSPPSPPPTPSPRAVPLTPPSKVSPAGPRATAHPAAAPLCAEAALVKVSPARRSLVLAPSGASSDTPDAAVLAPRRLSGPVACDGAHRLFRPIPGHGGVAGLAPTRFRAAPLAAPMPAYGAPKSKLAAAGKSPAKPCAALAAGPPGQAAPAVMVSG